MAAHETVFGFSEFLTGSALLVIAFTVGDIRYRFRLRVAPIPLYALTFGTVLFIGIGTLGIDVWYAEGWPTLPGPIGEAGLQALFGAAFLLVLLTWIFIAFIRPPTFGRSNARQYAGALYRAIMRGSDVELSTIADELARSAPALVALCPELIPRWQRHEPPAGTQRVPISARYAHDMLMLIGNRKFCKQIAKDSPGTAIAFFSEMTRQHKYNIPIGDFAQNISGEMILNTDSILYHENYEYSSNLIGIIRPFSQAAYGDYALVESLQNINGSPINPRYDYTMSFNGIQYKAYCVALKVVIDAYIECEQVGTHSYSIINAFNTVEEATRDLYKLNDEVGGYYYTDQFAKLDASMNLVKGVVSSLNKGNIKPVNKIKSLENAHRAFDLYDELVDILFEIIFDCASIREESKGNWSVQHNAVWSRIYGMTTRDLAWKAVQLRLQRKIYEEIRQMDRFANFRGAAIISVILNVMGFKLSPRKGYSTGPRSLHKFVLCWVKTNYVKICTEAPDVAAHFLSGGITYDVDNRRLVKTYSRMTRAEPPRVYLDLD